MTSKGLNTETVAVGVALLCGIIIWTPASTVTALQTYMHQLISPGPNPDYLKAENASPSLVKPLQSADLQELLGGMRFLLSDQFEKALPILSRYANLGDPRAQWAMGSIYYFGLGLPQDRSQALQWFRLAANQGNPSDVDTLAQAAEGTLVWDKPSQQPAYSGSIPTYVAPPTALAQNNDMYAPPVPIPTHAQILSPSASPTIGAFVPVVRSYGSEPSNRIDDSNMPRPARMQDPAILNRAGPNSFSDQNGGTYTSAGPHGVINNQTGQFSPTN